MKANELRIGNLAYRTNKSTGKRDLIQITPSCIMDISANGERSSFIYELIQLTEEWLLRFGFQKDDRGCYWVNLLTHYLELEKSDCFWFPVYAQIPEFSHEKEQRVSLNSIEFVHQLQNLYFAITGEELTLKE